MGTGIGDAQAKRMMTSVLAETQKALKAAQGGSATLSSLFHGAGSQKPASATHQFIVQAGKRGMLG